MRRMFAVLTAMLEDASVIAMDGQREHTPDELSRLAYRIVGDADQIATIAEATTALIEQISRADLAT